MNIKNIKSEKFTDVPSSNPEIKIPLERVGITNRPHYINVIDPFNNKPTKLLAYIEIYSNLNENQRGLHLSRFESQLHKMEKIGCLPIDDFNKTLCEKISKSQAIKNCEIAIKILYENNVSKNESKRPSHELFNLINIIKLNEKGYLIKKGIKIPIINACPCTQRWAIKDFYISLQNLGYDDQECGDIILKSPLQAHTNKGSVTIIIQNDTIEYIQIYNIIETSVPILRELLSGRDEHSLVTKANMQGLFCEDVARLLIKNTVEQLKDELDINNNVNIEVEIDESIHYHNLKCVVDNKFGDLQNLIG